MVVTGAQGAVCGGDRGSRGPFVLVTGAAGGRLWW